jgi:DHA1 family tetracycline resistance protein-like MFS transporter
MPELITEIQGGDIAGAAIWGGVLATSFAAMQFLFGPTLGSLSDRYGRRPILLISLVSMGCAKILMAVAGTIWILLLGRIVAGTAAATQATASAYMADISDPDQKAKNFGRVGAAFGIGFVLGPALGGMLAEFGTRAPFYAAAALAFGNALLGYFVLTETVDDRIRRPFEWRRANPLSALLAVSKLPGLQSLLLVMFLYYVAVAVYPSVWPFFTAERFGWAPQMIGLSLAIFGLSYALVQGVLVQPAINRLGHRGTIYLGLGLEVVMLLLISSIALGWLTLMLTPLAALAAIGQPALQGIMSRKVADNAQGQLQGVLASLSAVSMIIAPLVMSQVFARYSGASATVYFPGAPFVLAASLMAVAALVFAMRPSSRSKGS